MIAGVRTGTIDDFTFEDVKSCCAIELAIHNEESIKSAIKMNLAGKFAEVYKPYEQINRKFLMEIMLGYETELKEAHKLAIKVRDEANKPKEPTPEEIQQRLVEGVLKGFHAYKQTKDLSIISHVEYDYLTKCGITLVTPERKKQLMVEAKSQLTVIYAQGSIGKGIAEVQKSLVNGTVDQEIVMVAKKLAVRDYYETIERLEL